MSVTMTARKKPKRGPQPPPPPPEPTPPPPPPPGRTGKSLQLYIPADLADAFDAHVDASRPKTTKTAIIVMLLEDFLRKAGNLPTPGGPTANEDDEEK